MNNYDYGTQKPKSNMHKRKCEELRKVRVEVARTLGVPELVREEPCNYNGECQGTCPACYMEEKALMDRIYELSKNGVAFTLKESEFEKEPETPLFYNPPVPPYRPYQPPIVQGMMRPNPPVPPVIPSSSISEPEQKKRGILDKIKGKK